MKIRLRFSLRVLLVLMLLFGCLLVPFVRRLNEAKRQKAAVEAITRSGGGVTYDYQFDEDKEDFIYPEPSPPGPQWVRSFLGDDFFCRVTMVAVCGENTRTHLASLKELPYLKGVTCGGGIIGKPDGTDADILHLKDLKNLEGLALSSTHVTDAGLEHLRGLKNLEWLDLIENQVTDAGLVHLNKNLRHLSLQETHVTDAGLEHLKGLKHLEHLILQNRPGSNDITDEGLAELQKALPNCLITFELPRWTPEQEARFRERYGQ